MKIIAPIKVEWLDITIEIINVSTWETVDTWDMIELSYWHYAYEFEWYVPWEDYFIRATDGWTNTYETTTWYENLLSDVVYNKIDEWFVTQKWSLWTVSVASQWWTGWSGISIEQLNTSVEYIIWTIEESTKDIKKDINDSSKELKKLSGIQTDIKTAIELQKKDFINVDIDYNKIIEAINSIKWDISNDDIKNDIRELLLKMDAYKQLDIIDITDAIEYKLSEVQDESKKAIVTSIKNNFKDLNNKIKDLKEFNEKLDINDRTKVIESTYDILKTFDDVWVWWVVDKLKSISNRVDMMHDDILTFNE